MTAGFIASNGEYAENIAYETEMDNENALNQPVDIISNGDGTFNVQVSGITASVCKQIVNKDLDVPIYIGDTEVTSPDNRAGDDIQLVFLFANDLSVIVFIDDDREETEEDNCTNKPLISYNGKCYACDEPASVYVYGVTGNCTTACGDTRVLKGKYCVLKSCPDGYPLVDNEGGCHACDEIAGINVSGITDNCAAACPDERYLDDIMCNLIP